MRQREVRICQLGLSRGVVIMAFDAFVLDNNLGTSYLSRDGICVVQVVCGQSISTHEIFWVAALLVLLSHRPALSFASRPEYFQSCLV